MSPLPPTPASVYWIALLSFFLWGFFPIYWRTLAQLDPLEILSHRIIWSAVFYGIVFGVAYRRQKSLVKPTVRHWAAAAFAAAIIAFNWGLYIYAVNSGRILESSLAYFLNPLLNVAVGVWFFRESFPLPLKIAVLLAGAGLATQLHSAGEFPWIAVLLASTFCLYGIIKKVVPMKATLGSAMEGAVGFLPAILAAVYLRSHSPVPELSLKLWLLLMGGGIVTGLPLVLFSYAAQKVPYSVLGIMQFVAPTLQFFAGYLVFHEALTSSRLLAFCLVWAGGGFYLLDRTWRLSRRKYS